ncbi:MAG TPA: hypothetical protein VG013_15540 [Gemmataceae bacterium]|nr:hypothetical protein [Gemmataceae bacterium]
MARAKGGYFHSAEIGLQFWWENYYLHRFATIEPPPEFWERYPDLVRLVAE